MWTDAAGASHWLSAVPRTGDDFRWTRAMIPEITWRQLLPRNDEQIGAQELLALPLMMATFGPWLQGALVMLAVDNSGVVGSMISGRGSAADHNAAIGRIWLDFAAANMAVHFIRVESACNVADGPTREDFSYMARLQAEWLDPKWPLWIEDFWTIGADGAR